MSKFNTKEEVQAEILRLKELYLDAVGKVGWTPEVIAGKVLFQTQGDVVKAIEIAGRELSEDASCTSAFYRGRMLQMIAVLNILEPLMPWVYNGKTGY